MLSSRFCSVLCVHSTCTWNRSSKANLACVSASVGTSPLRPQPSLSRGWILQHKRGSAGTGIEEVLLSTLEEPRSELELQAIENGKELEISESLRISGIEMEKGMRLVPEAKYVRGADIKKESFIRVYYISALRVPAKDCHELERNLDEHLLNWPRVDNIARVRGDDVDHDLENLFRGSKEWSPSTAQAIRSAIYGEEGAINEEAILSNKDLKLVESGVKGMDDQLSPTSIRCQPYTVEVVDEQANANASGGLLGILKKKWTGPTRLLLLNEELVGRSFAELPPSIKVLKDLLPSEVEVPDAFERIGHVAFLNLNAEQCQYRHLIAQVTLDKHQPRVRSVVNKREARNTRSYAVHVEVLAGTSSLVTTVWENGIPFRIDLASVIWDSRLRADRQRLVGLFCRNDVVCDVFAGPGPVSVPAGFKVRRTFANEVNPVAYKYLAQNVTANKVASKVEVFNLDTSQFLENVFDPERPSPVTQVVMAYPSAAADFLDFFCGAFKRRTWELPFLPKLHLYTFSSGADPAKRVSQDIENTFGVCPKDMDVVLIAEEAPGEWMLRASFTIPPEVGFR
ncbi:hypothetical protein AXG93_872s1060 [Marchantia polymorpha subsp. ruderalis]|uniref:tRNA (guanine(37)-N1)-methyltransferase n=1 Tax=Marchantia polymorpha subsp. ruderalis TaxID=1480154 RepID=A0A176VKQ5_MARPO|nr:hypothetical protein AXG93_872s1060 [Marchantia polymorpha subsp. ruderalis]